jgi:hypothetical protein
MKSGTPEHCIVIGVRDGGLQSRKVGQMFNISRAKSRKLKRQKVKKCPVCCSNKGSRAIFASKSGIMEWSGTVRKSQI